MAILHNFEPSDDEDTVHFQLLVCGQALFPLYPVRGNQDGLPMQPNPNPVEISAFDSFYLLFPLPEKNSNTGILPVSQYEIKGTLQAHFAGLARRPLVPAMSNSVLLFTARDRECHTLQINYSPYASVPTAKYISHAFILPAT